MNFLNAKSALRSFTKNYNSVVISISEINNIVSINEMASLSPDELVEMSERYFRFQVEKVAKKVSSLPGNRLVMLAGPSSSGKTTTASLLSNDLLKNGRGAKVISLDDFYRDQNEKIYFEDGTPDFETVKSLDTEKIKECLSAITEKGECLLPRFSFITGKREKEPVHFKLQKDEVVIVEGLHALNPVITDSLDSEKLTKLYVSVSSRVMNKNEVFLSKRDIRFIRRMVRDYLFRNSEVDYTFYLWNGVRMGEDRYLFPFKDLADIKIDSFHSYEMCVLKETALSLLSHIEKDSPYFERSKKLFEKLSQFVSIEKEKMPESSLLREFIGQEELHFESKK